MRSAAVALLAVALLSAACGSESGEQENSAGAPTSVEDGLEGPTLRDHWHAAYGVWVCDHFVPDLEDDGPDLVGIHTHNDGLIHIHPFTQSAAGARATMGYFFDQVALEVDDVRMTLPTGESYAAGDECDGAPGVLRILEWPSAGNVDEVIVHTERFRELRLRHTAAFTIAFMHPDTPPDDLIPPSVAALGSLEEQMSTPLPDLPTATTMAPDVSIEVQRACNDFSALASAEAAPEEVLAFRPVLASMDSRLCDLDGVPADAAGTLHALGPALPPELVERADVQLKPGGQWVVMLTLNPGRPGIDTFNEFVAHCYPPSEECPTGQLAVVVDGTVVSAPVVQASEFARDAIVVSGAFTEEEARALAASLN